MSPTVKLAACPAGRALQLKCFGRSLWKTKWGDKHSQDVLCATQGLRDHLGSLFRCEHCVPCWQHSRDQ